MSAASLAGGLTGYPSEKLTVPVSVDDAAGVRAVELHITYDTNVLDADSKSVLPGSVWGGRGSVMTKVDDDKGTIVAWLFSSRELGPATGSLVDIRFTVDEDAIAGAKADIDLTRLELNEGQIVVDPSPRPGKDGADGWVMVAGHESVVAASQQPKVSSTAKVTAPARAVDAATQLAPPLAQGSTGPFKDLCEQEAPRTTRSNTLERPRHSIERWLLATTVCGLRGEDLNSPAECLLSSANRRSSKPNSQPTPRPS
jgi:hypothetical protein